MATPASRTSRVDGLTALDMSRRSPPPTANHVDRSSLSPVFGLAAAPQISPEPAYIAAAAAANVVTGEIMAEFDLDERALDANIAPGSLALINAFLDRLLFNILASARSTGLRALRPAVVDVLKARLAQEAIAGADEELQEYLGGDEEELQELQQAEGTPTNAAFDLDATWRRTRLRCMLYTRLGDMVEEDEELYLDTEADANASTTIQPAVAIFLTSILEFVGEHALMVAGQAAYVRLETRSRLEQTTQTLHRIVVEESDMEKVALNPTLGRLWRAWRKAVRSPRTSAARMSRDRHRALSGGSASRKSSIGTLDSRVHTPDLTHTTPSMAEVLADELAEARDPTTIPLPMTAHDVDEIEVPGYSAALAWKQHNARDGVLFRESSFLPLSGRPNSLLLAEMVGARLPLATHAEDRPPAHRRPLGWIHARAFRQRPRSNSLPTPQTPFFAGPNLPRNEDEPETPTEHDVDPRATAAAGHTPLGKRNSAPSSPYQGSMLEAMARHAARDYNLAAVANGDPHELPGDMDPAEGALRFDRSDYRVDDYSLSDAVDTPPRPPMPPKSRHRPTPLPMSGDSAPKTATLASPARIGRDAVPQPPVVQAHASGEVSPMEAGYELEHEMPSGTVSPLVIPSKAQAASRNLAASNAALHAATAAQAISRGVPARSRRTEGPTDQDLAKDEKREAFVVTDDFSAHTATVRPMPAPRLVDVPRPSSSSERSPDATNADRKSARAMTDVNGAAAAAAAAAARTPTGDPQQRTSREVFSREPSHAEGLPADRVRQVYRPRAASSSPVDRVFRRPVAVTRPTNHSAENAPPRNASPSSAAPEVRTMRSLDPSYNQSLQSQYMEAEEIDPLPRRRKGSQRGETMHRSNLSGASADDAHKHHRRRSSSVPAAAGGPTKSFEQLIDSGETIQYTLTSHSMREIEGRSSTSTRSASASRGITNSPRSGNGRALVERSSPKSARSGMPVELPGSPTSADHPNGLSMHSVSAASAASGQAGRRAGLPSGLRDGRSVGDHGRDLNEYPRANSTDAIHPTNNSRQINGSFAPTPAARRQAAQRQRTRLQPRDATGKSGDTSDLVQVLQQGPPEDITPGAQRMPNGVGPRMPHHQIEEDLPGLMPGRTIRPVPSVASTQDSYSRSFQSSSNSRTGLLDQSGRLITPRGSDHAVATPRASDLSMETPRGSGNVVSSPLASSESAGGIPKRKQRRVRDPYAIDSDDEAADEVDDEMPTPTARREESLMDFLNSVPPPSNSNSGPPQPFDIQATRNLGRKSSASSLRSRFMPSARPTGRGLRSPSNGPKGPRMRPMMGTGPSSSDRLPVHMHASDDHLMASSLRLRHQTSMGTMGMGASASASGSIMLGGAARRQQLRARTENGFERPTDDNMRELAQFLKSSAPPDPLPQVSPMMRDRDDTAFSKRVFSRRKNRMAVV